MPSPMPSEAQNGLYLVNGGESQLHAERNGASRYVVERNCKASSSSLKQATTSIDSTLSSSHSTTSRFKASTYSTLPSGSLLVRQTSSAGRGVFADVPLQAGTLIEVSHVLLFPAEEYEKHGRHTQLDEYTYIWHKGAEGNTMALALGLGSLFNHSHQSPNVKYMLDRECGTIQYTLTRDVLPGEELMISYGTGQMWWEDVSNQSRQGVVANGTNGSNGYGPSSHEDDSYSSDERLEDELMTLSNLGLDQDEAPRAYKRRDDRRRLASHDRVSSTSSPTTSIAPILTPPAMIGPEAAPLWRITAAVDPRTSPLELMLVWAVDIDPRKTSNFLKFSHSIARRLKTAEEGGDGQGHVRSKQNCNHDDANEGDADSEDSEGNSEEEDDSMKHLRLFHRMHDEGCLTALVARVEDIPSVEKVTALLQAIDVVKEGTIPMPFHIRVPRHPAPSRERLNEWKIHWPVVVKHGKRIDLLLKTSLSNSLTSQQGNTIPGMVDRAADAKIWADKATAWAIKHFKKCIELARHAKSIGELPIGVHVIPSYNEAEVDLINQNDSKSWVEIDAWDTRTSERNPIKHAIINAIRDVAKVRSDRDRERLQALCAIVATLNRDPNAHPHAEKISANRNEETSNGAIADSNSSSPRLANNQDYLLNGLTLFTTHEPCMYCCMALVHSRVQTIFFIKPSPGAGGCCGSGLRPEMRCSHAEDGGPYAVQEQAGLNHHFDVWKWVGDDSLLSSGDDLDRILDIAGLDA